MLIGFGLFLTGVLFTLAAVWLLIKRRILLAGLNGTAGVSMLSVATLLGLILFNVHSYHQLTSESELAEIEIGVSTPDGVPVKIQTDVRQQVFNIHADEWQLDARFLKWKPWASLLGSEPLVRLESLSGRYPQQGRAAAEFYNLVEQNPLLISFGTRLSEWLGLVDSYYGSSVYMPAAEGAIYRVTASNSGLVARPENTRAEEAVRKWRSQ